MIKQNNIYIKNHTQYLKQHKNTQKKDLGT